MKFILLALSLLASHTDASGGPDADPDLPRMMEEAISNADVVALKELLQQGADVETSLNEAGDTPLVLAAYYGHTACVELLVAHGSDVNATNHYGETALRYVAKTNRTTCVELLLWHGADPNAEDTDGMTPLMCAASDGQASFAALLLRGGAAVDTDDNAGRTALQHCAEAIESKATSSLGSPDRLTATARVLMESGADPDEKDIWGLSPRTLAPDVMRILEKERDRAVTTAAVASSLMSGLCGEHSGSLLASFLATPWMLTRTQPMPEWVHFGAKLRKVPGLQS